MFVSSSAFVEFALGFSSTNTADTFLEERHHLLKMACSTVYLLLNKILPSASVCLFWKALNFWQILTILCCGWKRLKTGKKSCILCSLLVHMTAAFHGGIFTFPSWHFLTNIVAFYNSVSELYIFWGPQESDTEKSDRKIWQQNTSYLCIVHAGGRICKCNRPLIILR